jgi:hypothetical protein
MPTTLGHEVTDAGDSGALPVAALAGVDLIDQGLDGLVTQAHPHSDRR